MPSRGSSGCARDPSVRSTGLRPRPPKVVAGSGGEGRLLSATRYAFTVASRLAEVAAEDDIAEAEWITCGITEHPERTEWAVADTAEEPPALLRPLHRAVPQPRPPRTRPPTRPARLRSQPHHPGRPSRPGPCAPAQRRAAVEVVSGDLRNLRRGLGLPSGPGETFHRVILKEEIKEHTFARLGHKENSHHGMNGRTPRPTPHPGNGIARPS